MASAASIRLLEADPDLGRFLGEEERAALRELWVPVRTVDRGPLDLDRLLGGAGAFGALVLDGMLVYNVQVGPTPATRPVAPGDLVIHGADQRPELVVAAGLSAAATTRLALLDRHALLAVRHWPQLVTGLLARVSEQAERASTQLAICQLSRVDARLLAMMWLLAESWGRVTRLGTSLPVELTHDMLGAMVGARRPTVTLALGELIDRGAIVRQDPGWLLVEPPPRPPESAPLTPPRLSPAAPSVWADQAGARREADTYAALSQTVAALRESHTKTRHEVTERLDRIRQERERMARGRRELAAGRDSPGPRSV